VGVLQLRGAFFILPRSGLKASSTWRGGRLRRGQCRRDVNDQNRKRELQFSFSDGHAPAGNQFVVPSLAGSFRRGSIPCRRTLPPKGGTTNSPSVNYSFTSRLCIRCAGS